MVFNNNLLLGAAGAADGYTIDQSIRFNDNDSARLYSTSFSASPTSSTDCTFSTWVKRGNFGSYQAMLYGGNPAGSTYEVIRFDNDEDLRIAQASSAYDLKTDQKFRDVAGWYHIVVAFDTNNATASERIKLYVNGERVTSFSTETYPSSGYSTNMTAGGASIEHVLGANSNSGPASQFLDGYQAEINFIDGQALDPTSFGETNSTTGQWVPVKYTGSYGVNGFYLKGEDSSNLGNDSSGNGNNFTSSGLTAADQVTDSPTDNFCTMSSINKYGGLTLADGNLKVSAGAQIFNKVNGTFWVDADQGGAWYFEYTVGSNNDQLPGWTGSERTDKYPGQSTDSYSYAWARNGGAAYNPAGSTSAHTGSGTYVSGDVLGWLIDFDNNEVKVGKVSSGTWSATITWTDLGTYKDGGPAGGAWTATDRPYNGNGTFNFGQTGGFAASNAPGQALKTSNLSDPTIALPEKYFNTVLYEGNGGGQRVGQFQPITETYTVPNSVIFNDDDSAYLTRTPSSASNKRTWTFSVWAKRGNLGADRRIFTAATNGTEFFFDANDKLNFYHYSGGFVWQYISNAVFKDSSAWNHFVLRVDTTDATSGDRIRVYVNGVQITDWGTSTAPSLNAEGFVNGTSAHYIGRYSGSDNNHWDGYLAEINHIDGSSLGPDSFGQLDASTNRWIPKDASGLTFGTNGFYLDMETAPGTGSGAGTDSSGNGNNFTESGLAASDQVTDSPTDNFTTLNPLINSGVTLSSGNLTFTGGSGDDAVPATIPLKTGKWYWEMDLVSWSSSASVVFGGGIVDMDAPYSEMQAHYAGYAAALPGLQYPYSNPSRTIAWDKTGNDVSVTGLGTCANGDIIQFALDLDNGALYIGRNNTWLNSGDPESGSSRTGSVFPVTPNVNGWAPVANSRGSSYELQFNFGQSGGFTYTPPTGFSAISADSLPLSNGDLSAFVWIKNRDAADNHMLFDAVRGVTKDLHSNSTAAEVTNANTLTRFLKNGFEVSNDAEVNTSGESYVAWQWLNDSLSTSANTDGSTSSTVLANTTSGFSIATYTGTGSAATIGHGLGVAPSMVIVKKRDSGTDDAWIIWHQDLAGPNYYLNFDTGAPDTSVNYWNNTLPTSSVFSVGASNGTNQSSKTFVSYCFAEVDGFSKFGSYTGNGSTDGAFVYTGFKPAFVLWKQYTNLGTNSWGIRDSARDPSNVVESVLRPDTTGTETTASSAYADFLSNGFKLRATDGFVNKASSNYLYMAFAESPFKTATAR